jgi:hypothetical protein
MQINTEFYESMTPEKMDHILAELKNKGNQKPSETRWAELF